MRVRRTFLVGADGYEGLLKDKKALVITTRGGSYAGEPFDFQEPYLQAVFDFIGVTNVTFIHAENLAMGAEERQLAIANAHEAIQHVEDVGAAIARFLSNFRKSRCSRLDETTEGA